MLLSHITLKVEILKFSATSAVCEYCVHPISFSASQFAVGVRNWCRFISCLREVTYILVNGFTLLPIMRDWIIRMLIVTIFHYPLQ